MIQYQGNSYVLAVRSFDATVAFFKEVMELEQVPSPPGWIVLCSARFSIWIGLCPDDIPAAEAGPHSFFAYVVVDDVASIRNKILLRSDSSCTPLRRSDTTHMEEFYCTLPEGHRIGIGRRID